MTYLIGKYGKDKLRMLSAEPASSTGSAPGGTQHCMKVGDETRLGISFREAREKAR